MEDREKTILVHPSGVEFTIFLTKYEIERAEADQQFLEEITQKYYDLYVRNLITSRSADELTIQSSESSTVESQDVRSLEIEVFTEEFPGTSEESQLHSQDSLEGNSVQDRDVSIWVMRGRETDDDREATKYLLLLRGSERFRKKFDDKKSVKLQLWKDIAEEMCAAGFAVGRGRLGAKRCQQKFSNLYKTYLGFLKHVGQTGAERKSPPEYFDDMHNILGGKDKIFPQCTFDAEKGLTGPSSIKIQVSDQVAGPSNIAGGEAGYPSIAGPSNIQANVIPHLGNESDLNDEGQRHQENQQTPTSRRDRFKDVPGKLKPSKNDEIISAIRDMHQESTRTQQDQFNKIVNLISEQNSLLREQNLQRDRLINILAKSRGKKRRHHDSSDTDTD